MESRSGSGEHYMESACGEGGGVVVVVVGRVMHKLVASRWSGWSVAAGYAREVSGIRREAERRRRRKGGRCAQQGRPNRSVVF